MRGVQSAGKWILALALIAACSAFAEPVKITFLPPPMEGQISLGVYDTAGRLVRILHREIDPDELTKGDDGLVTQWDGKDDQGKPCPPGTYRARGVMVGELGVEGVDFIGNDWVTDDDSPRVRRIDAMEPAEKGGIFMQTATPGNPFPVFFTVYPAPILPEKKETSVILVPFPQTPPAFKQLKPPMPLSGLGKVEAWTAGTLGSVWVLRANAVKQYSKAGKLLYTLESQPDDPPPLKLACALSPVILYVLYENATLQRLRGYDFTGVKPGGEPKVLFENDIHASDTYEQIASELQFPDEQPFVPSPTLTVALVPNPLTHNKPGTLQIRAGVDKDGCYLATLDGLPLCHISDTKDLRWAVMGRAPGSNTITLFESDGAVVEAFQVSKIDHMMPFNAGTIQWPGETPTPSPVPALP
ncbi:MAG: hypothetical protein NTZ46_04115 [Verrucomicrobia bacterium]|nr:hypothetical protein [Verrucomicrobiota bacterium]